MGEDTSLGKVERGNEKGACWEDNVLIEENLQDAVEDDVLERAEEGKGKGRET